jgi:hypothetical protein
VCLPELKEEEKKQEARQQSEEFESDDAINGVISYISTANEEDQATIPLICFYNA